MVEQVDLEIGAEFQTHWLQEMDYSKISRGATVPPIAILGCVPDGGWVLNVGCGPGEKVLEFVKEAEVGGIKTIGVDFNSAAIAHANQLNEQLKLDHSVKFLVADLTKDLVGLLFAAGYGRFPFDVGVAEGLFCNTLGDKPRKVLASINRLLRPRGRLLVADCLRVDDKQGEKVLSGEGYSKEYIEAWQYSWLKRYGNNLKVAKEVEGLDLRDGEFLVVAPGDAEARDVKDREFGGPEDLKNLLRWGMIERCARHQDRNEWGQLVREAGFRQLFWDDTVWFSRTGEPTLGMVAGFEKVAESG